MPALSSPSTWRTHPHAVSVFAYISQPAAILTCAINQTSFEYPLSQFTYDGAVGSFANVKQFMTVKISDSSGNRKGFTYIRELPTSSLLYIGVLSQGDIDLQENDIVEVLNDFRIWARIPSIDALGEQFKDWVIDFGTQAAQPPVANASPWYANKVDGSNIITVDFDGTNSFPVAPSATISAYAWDEDDGTITVGTSSSSSITATFPPGERWVELQVTDSAGGTHKAHTWVVAATDATALKVEVASLQGDVDNGWQIQLQLLEGDVSDYLPGSPIIVWVEERYGGVAGSLNGFADREHVIFCGWLTEETITVEPLQSDWDITAVNAVGILQKVPASNITTLYDDTPSNWFEVAGHNLWRHAHHVMHWHSTFLNVCDVERPAWYSLPGYSELSADGQTLYEQLAFVANAVNAYFTCDRNGRCYFRENPQFMTTAERGSLTTTVTLADTDWSDSINIKRRHRKPVRILWGEGLVSSNTQYIPKMAVAPGTIPGQGEREERLNRQLLSEASTAQADINTRTGRAYAVANLEDPTIPINIFLGGLVADPAWQEKIVWTLSTDKSTRQYGYSSQQFGLASVRVSYDHNIGATEEDWELEKLVDTTVIDGVAIQLPGQDPPVSGVYIPTYGTISQQLPVAPPPAPFAPPVDDEVILAVYALIWDADTYATQLLSLTSPTYDSLFDDTDDVASVAHTLTSDFFSDNTQVLAGWILTSTGLWAIDDFFGDYFGRTPSITEKQSISGYTLLRHVAGVSAQAIAAYGVQVSTDPTADFGGVNGQGDWQLVTFSADTADQEYASDQWQNEVGAAGESVAIALLYDAGVGQRITAVSLDVEWHCTRNRGGAGADVFYNFATDGNIDFDDYTSSSFTTVAIADYGGVNPISQSGSDTIGQTGLSTRYFLGVFASAITSVSSGHFYITAITLTFDDGSVKILYSADNGDTISETTFWAAIDGSSFAAGDVDDFGLGVHIVGSESSLGYSTAYDGAFTALDLTPIGSNVITCIRIPYRKLLTQALNNDATALQFIYALDNGDLWGVTFDTIDGSIISENEMTIEIASTTYYVVGPEALETAGTNTQVILAFVKPVGGGSTILALSTSGGTLGQWSNQQTLEGNFVRWVFGSSTQAALSGDGGAWLTQNRGSTVQVKTGDLPGNAKGFIAFPQA